MCLFLSMIFNAEFFLLNQIFKFILLSNSLIYLQIMGCLAAAVVVVVFVVGFLVSDSAILELNRLQITGMRSAEGCGIVNFIPVTHIASEGERHKLLGVCALVLKAWLLMNSQNHFLFFINIFILFILVVFEWKETPK